MNTGNTLKITNEITRMNWAKVRILASFFILILVIGCGPRDRVNSTDHYVFFQPISHEDLQLDIPVAPVAFKEINLSVPRVGARLDGAATKSTIKHRGVVMSSEVDNHNYILESDIHAEIFPHLSRLVSIDPSNPDTLSVEMKVSVENSVKRASWGRHQFRYTVRVRLFVSVRREGKQMFSTNYNSTDTHYSFGEEMNAKEFSNRMKTAYIRAYKKLAKKLPRDMKNQRAES